MSRILLLGGGHARPPLLHRLARLKRAGHDLGLVTPAPQFWAEAIPPILAGRVDPAAASLDAAAMATRHGLYFFDDDITRIDPAAGQVHRRQGEPLGFDLLSIAPTALTRPLPGTGDHPRCFSTRPLPRLLALHKALVERFRQHPGRAVALTIAGGGITACGLALAMIALAAREGGHIAITILTRGRLLTRLPEPAGVRLIEALAAHGTILQEMAPVLRVEGNEAVLEGGDRIAFDLFLNATGAAGPGWLRDSGLAVDADGRLLTDAALGVSGFARMIAGGEAVRPAEGRHPGWSALTSNLIALAGSRPPHPAPQQPPPCLIDIGDGTALAAWGRWWTLGGPALWALRWLEGRWLL
ncbi:MULTISPECIES: NAD(P)/FAD-dependent oxidoreductase [unclassified Azospirillum]|uniref:NAD(P)/FAD-dependent oxidoreductase n=1 Tax=unclassified Azospirillum TaxID=2630922 RepID=UPI000B687E5C|nr:MULTISPECIES: FAD-dependent oxidoreductase [unclassified Azospirillum]SNR88040.1 NADH dehydrogenase, FAD-containing subunit [Azospirillum sp. RU38E]SNS04217.1 NADH dehydrogenase, FAD-containing subunit [Azospirillum sp. RU37A]